MTRQGVVDAHRFLLGRDPAGEDAIAAALTDRALVATLIDGTEFGDMLDRLAVGRAPPHAALDATQLREALAWAAAQGWPVPDRAATPLARLIGALLAAPPVAVRVAAHPRAAALAAGCGPLAPLLTPATVADARALGLLLFGAAPGAAPRPVPLLDLLRAALHAPRLRTVLLDPLAAGARPPAFALPATAMAACVAWAADRLGAPRAGGVAAALAAVLGHPAAAEWLARAGAQAALDRLPDLASGALPLRALRATADDVAQAYLATFGRAVESAAAGRVHEGAPLDAVLRILLDSEEFRTAVLHRLVDGAAPAHVTLDAGRREGVRDWLAARLGLPGEASGGAALLARLLGLPVLEGAVASRHGPLWRDARAALTALAEPAAGPLGGIEYVTGSWIAGWAFDPDAPERAVEIELRCDDAPVALGRADRRRPDAADGPPHGGFRLPWRGRDRAATGGAQRFRIHDAVGGAPIGPAFVLDAIFHAPRTTVQLLTAELAEARRTLARIEAMLPQLESFSAFAPEAYAAFRAAHRVAPPPAAGPLPPVRVVVDARGVPTAVSRRTLAALQAQTHADWTATVLHDADGAALVAAAAAREPRFVPDTDCGDAALVLLLPAGMLPDPAALAWLADTAARHPAAVAAFADEDTLTEVARWQDRPSAPVLRAALDPFALPLGNPCGEAIFARGPALRAALAAAGPLDGAARSWVVWAALAAAGPVAHVPRLLFSRVLPAPPPPPVPAAALRPLLAEPWLLDGDAALPAGDAPITAIVPTRNGGALLAEALDSLRARAAQPARLRLLAVDNGSDDPTTLGVLRGREVLRIDEPFNWSRLNNRAAAAVRDGLLLFVNDDTRMLTAGWDDRLRRLLGRPGIGAVGARLVYDDLSLQHAGIVFGAEGIAAHEGVGAALDAPGPDGRWQRLRSVGGVTGAFLATSREDFAALGGFDEHALGVTFNDVDFCLRLRAAGLRVLYDPALLLVHHESKSRGIDDQDAAKRERAEAEARALVARWGDAVRLDPGWNPHWSRWAPPFAALRDPSAAEIAAHVAATATADPWRVAPA